MAIHTRLGSDVRIIGYNHNTGDIEVEFNSGDTDMFAIYELVADGGIQEIDEAIKEV